MSAFTVSSLQLFPQKETQTAGRQRDKPNWALKNCIILCHCNNFINVMEILLLTQFSKRTKQLHNTWSLSWLHKHYGSMLLLTQFSKGTKQLHNTWSLSWLHKHYGSILLLTQFGKGITHDHYNDFISTMEALLLSSVNVPNNCITRIHYDSKRIM